MIALQRLTPMLWTNDLAGTIAFYRDTLNFELDEYNEDWGWCHLHNGDVNMMFALPNEQMPYNGEPVCTGSFYFYTEDVDGAYEQLSGKAEVCYAPENFAHNMREFGIYDNNGYLLQFGRSLKEGEEIEDVDE